MPPPLDNLPLGSRVLLVRLRSLGDCVLTTPAIAILKQYRPDLHLAVAVEDRFRGIFEGNPDIGALLGPSLLEAYAFRPKLTLNLHGGTRSFQLTLVSMAALRAGYGHYRHGWAYNVRIPRAQQILGEERTVHTAEHAASAMFYLGVPRCEIPRARLFAAQPPASEPYAVIHPAASSPDKTWPAARFRQVASWIQSNLNLQPIFIAGPGDSLSDFDGFRQVANRPLPEVKSLLSGASLFVGNDSGPAHMAAAFGVPVVVLFGPSNPVIWAPWRTESEVVVSKGPLPEVAAGTVVQALERLRVRA